MRDPAKKAYYPVFNQSVEESKLYKVSNVGKLLGTSDVSKTFLGLLAYTNFGHLRLTE